MRRCGPYLYSQVDSQLQDDAQHPSAPRWRTPFGRTFGAGPGVIPPAGPVGPGARRERHRSSAPPEAYPLSPPEPPACSCPDRASTSTSPVLFDASSGGGPNVELPGPGRAHFDADGSRSERWSSPSRSNDLHHTLGRLVLIELLVSRASSWGWGPWRGGSCGATCGRSTRWPPPRGPSPGVTCPGGSRPPTSAPRSASSATRSTPC